MRLGTWFGTRAVRLAGLGCLALAWGCDQSDPPLLEREELSLGGEVFKVFCLRLANEALPGDPNGEQFVPMCETGKHDLDEREDEDGRFARLSALLDRRAETVSALDQVFGEIATERTVEVARSDEATDDLASSDDELSVFMLQLLPFYEEAEDTLLPRSTRALQEVLEKLRSEDDPMAVEVREKLAEVGRRLGYRAPEKVLAAVRSMLTYPELDRLSKTMLAFVMDGAANQDFLELLGMAALELAQKAEPDSGESTLDLLVDLVLGEDPGFKEDGVPTAWVLKRDEQGNGLLAAPSDEEPDSLRPAAFKLAGSDGDPSGSALVASYDDDQRALGADDQPVYQFFDANSTMLAALMRDSVPLVKRDGKDRSTVEKLLRALKPMIGGDMEVERRERFAGEGQVGAEVGYSGPDVEHSPLAELVHAAGQLIKYPETQAMLEVIEQLVKTNESDAMALIYAALELDKRAENDPAELIGPAGKGTPHEFWDDLIQIGQEIVRRKKDGAAENLLYDVLKASSDPVSIANGQLLGRLMRYADDVKLGQDKNGVPSAGCPAGADGKAPALCKEVDRKATSGGMNRSIFQRVVSMIHATYGVKNCNKKGATLSVTDPLPLTFPDPASRDPLVGGVLGLACAYQGTGNSYESCALVEQKDGAVTHMQAMLGKTKIKLKDTQLVCAAESFDVDLAASQERYSEIKGFDLDPTPQAIARYVYAPRTKFLTDLFDPFATKHGVPLVDFEPNGMFPLEIEIPEVQAAGKPQSFLTASLPLLQAFDKYEQINELGDPVGNYPDSYLFAKLLSLLHMHYPARTEVDCTTPIDPASNAGCSQHLDPNKPFYAHQTNLQSYEPLISHGLVELDLLGTLARTNQALEQIKVSTSEGELNGLQVLSRFLTKMLLPDPALKKLGDVDYVVTNRCEVTMQGGKPSCANNVGRVLEGGIPPLYLLLDGLKQIDKVWESDPERHALWLDVRSTLVDQLLTVVKKPDGKYELQNRRGYHVTRRVLEFVNKRIDAHARDLPQWVESFVPRIAGVLGHPIAARAIDLFDHFWDDPEVGDRVAHLTEYLVGDPQAEPFQGAVLALADTLQLMAKDPTLTPAIRFGALAITPKAIEAVETDGEPDLGDLKEGATWRLLEVTRKIAEFPIQSGELSTIAKLLNNAVVPMEGEGLAGKSPLEVLIDVVADVNRSELDKERLPLAADEHRAVYDQMVDFLGSKKNGLERLYEVIENRKIQ